MVEEVKVCLKPYYIKKHVNKEEYKEILRRAVPKVMNHFQLYRPACSSCSQPAKSLLDFQFGFQVCHSKTGEINPFKIRELVDAYVRKFRHSRKKSA